MRIYIASTPYHLLLAGALQIGAGDPPAILMYDDQYEFVRHSGSIDRAFPNVKVELLQSYDHATRWGSVLKSRASANAIRRCAGSVPDPRLYICTPTRRDFLRAAHCLKGSVPIHFVEDGLDAYLSHGITRPPQGGLVNRVGTRIVNGFPSPDRFDSTTVMEYEKFHLLFPEIRRTSIPLELVEVIKDTWFIESTQRLTGVVDRFIPDISPTDVWFPSLSAHITDVSAHLDSLRQWVASVSESAERVCAVKCHPREQNAELLSGLDSLQITRYPGWIPAELIVHTFSSNCRITTGLSTFVLSSQILLPQREIWLDTSVDPGYATVLNSWDKAIFSTKDRQ